MQKLGNGDAVWLRYLLVVWLGGCLVAPPLFWTGRALVHAGWVPQLAPFAFATYLRRAWLLCAACAAPMLRGRVRLDWRLGATGWRQAGAQVAGGFGLGGVGATVLGLGLLQAGWLVPNPSLAAPQVASRLMYASMTACAVGLIEEVLFRGLLLRATVRRYGPRLGSCISVVLFAALHFVATPGRGSLAKEVPWYGGLALTASALAPLLRPQLLAQSFVALLGVGWALTVAAQRLGTLWLAIGLHVAWVLVLRAMELCCVRLRPPDVWLTQELRGGLLPLALSLVTVAVLKRMRAKKAPPMAKTLPTLPLRAAAP